jgi:hypothetical protein
VLYDAVNELMEAVKLLKDEVVTNELVFTVAVIPISWLPSPLNDPVKDPVLYVAVNELNELVVTKSVVSIDDVKDVPSGKVRAPCCIVRVPSTTDSVCESNPLGNLTLPDMLSAII